MTDMTALRPTANVPRGERPNEEFERLVGPFRCELKAHCYRMLGSVDEADDLVQETYFRAWRSFDTFVGGKSLRAWLYRIATNACLNARERRKSREVAASDARSGGLNTAGIPSNSATAIAWLESISDSQFGSVADQAPTPEAQCISSESVKLAFSVAIQRLPPRQRAALLLCDVLGWAAAEAATFLGGSTASINSVLLIDNLPDFLYVKDGNRAFCWSIRAWRA